MWGDGGISFHAPYDFLLGSDAGARGRPARFLLRLCRVWSQLLGCAGDLGILGSQRRHPDLRSTFARVCGRGPLSHQDASDSGSGPPGPPHLNLITFTKTLFAHEAHPDVLGRGPPMSWGTQFSPRPPLAAGWTRSPPPGQDL